jgi:hypothetical protein
MMRAFAAVAGAVAVTLDCFQCWFEPLSTMLPELYEISTSPEVYQPISTRPPA